MVWLEGMEEVVELLPQLNHYSCAAWWSEHANDCPWWCGRCEPESNLKGYDSDSDSFDSRHIAF